MVEIKKYLWIFGFLLSILVSLNFFWSKPLVPGFDSPFYLSELREFSFKTPNPLKYPYLDRYLTIAFPAMLSRYFNLDPVTAYRIAISIIYIVLSLVIYRLFKNMIRDNGAAGIMSAALIISPFLITYSTMLFANFTAFLFLFLFFMVETENNLKYQNIYLGIILGLVFYIHNFSALAIGLIIISYLFLKLIFTNNYKFIKKGFLIFIIAGCLGSISIARYIKPETLIPKASAMELGKKISKYTQLQSPVVLGNETQRIKNSFIAHTGKYWLFFMFFFSILTIFIMKNDFKRRVSEYSIPLAILLPSLILTFQPLIGINFLPERFVTLVTLSSYLFYLMLLTLPGLKRYNLILATIPLLLNYLSSDNLILDKGYRSFSDTEIEFYKKIPENINTNSVILISSDHGYWAKYFLNKYTVISGDHFVSCGTIDEIGYQGEANFIFAKLLGEKDFSKATGHIKSLQAHLPERNIYILNDSSLSCGNGSILKNISQVKKVNELKSFTLYEII